MRALRSTRIISASAHPVSMQERVKSFPSVSGKASGSAGCPRTERGKLTVFASRCTSAFRGPQKRVFAATSQTWENAAQPSAPRLRQLPNVAKCSCTGMTLATGSPQLDNKVVSWSQSNTALICGAMESMYHSCSDEI